MSTSTQEIQRSTDGVCVHCVSFHNEITTFGATWQAGDTPSGFYADRRKFDHLRNLPYGDIFYAIIVPFLFPGHLWKKVTWPKQNNAATLNCRVMKSRNLMGWMNLRFAATSVYKRRREHTRRTSRESLQTVTYLIADIRHARYLGFYTPLAAISEICSRRRWRTRRISPIAAISIQNRLACPGWKCTTYSYGFQITCCV